MIPQPVVEVHVRQTAQMFLVRALLRVSDVDLPLPGPGCLRIVAEQRWTALRTSELASQQAKPDRQPNSRFHVVTVP